MAPVLLLALTRVTPVRVLADNGIAAMNQSSYVDGSNELHLVGEIQNNTGQAIEDVNIAASFVDANGKTAGGTQGYAEIADLQPGDVSSHDVTQFPAPTNMASYNLHMTWGKPLNVPAKGLSVQNDPPFDDGNGHIQITGQVQNNGTATAYNVDVVATFYHTDGTVAFVSDNHASPSTLNSGDVAQFELDQHSYPYNTYKVQVQARTGS